MKEDTAMTHHNYYGMTFKDCTFNNPTFQTVSSAREEEKREEKVNVTFDELNSSEACDLKKKLTEAGIVSGHWQPIGLSNAEKGVLAQYLAERLGVQNLWRTFGALWGMQPETLRRAAAKAMDQSKTLAFQDRLKELI